MNQTDQGTALLNMMSFALIVYILSFVGCDKLITTTVAGKTPQFIIQKLLKAKKTNGFNSCIVISVFPLDIPSIKKATDYRNNW